MLRKFFALLLIAATAAPFAAATGKYTPDRTQIAASMRDHAAYKALADRFASGQKLTAGEMGEVYYGAVCQPGFNASVTYPDIARTYAAGDYATTLSQVWTALAKDPANLYLLFTGYGAARSLKNDEAASLLQNRLLQVCDLIFSTGTGVTSDSPYLVVHPSDIDEFVVKYIQPVKVLGRATLEGCQAVRVNLDNNADDVILYFKTFN